MRNERLPCAARSLATGSLLRAALGATLLAAVALGAAACAHGPETQADAIVRPPFPEAPPAPLPVR